MAEALSRAWRLAGTAAAFAAFGLGGALLGLGALAELPALDDGDAARALEARMAALDREAGADYGPRPADAAPDGAAAAGAAVVTRASSARTATKK